MDQLHLLLLLSFSMLIGSFFSGTVPMAFKMSESKSRLLALMGSGILVGTALAIIIPEGIDSIYSNRNYLPKLSSVTDTPHITSKDHAKESIEPHDEPVQMWIIGLSLITGFLLMLLIDQFSLYQLGSSSHNHQSSQNSNNNNRHEYALANQDDDEEVLYNKDMSVSDDHLDKTSETRPIKPNHQNNSTYKVSLRGLDDDSDSQNNTTTIHRNLNRSTPTLGLVIHASADGIALGAAATTSHRDVEMIIFLAIMLHKAPAAFSLVVFLIHRGLKHSTIRRHLLAFSLSAPLAALLTYFGLSQSGKEALRRNNATGVAMLFSAGTFLYVATVHVLPELVNNKLLTMKEISFLVCGAFLPILLAQMI